jgi:YHS domain-containing protein
MKIVQNSLAAAGVAAMIAGAVPNPAYASEKSILNPLQIERSAGTIILAENKTKSKKIHKNNVILKGYDPVACFKQGKAVRGNPSITSTYKGATYFFASREDKADFDLTRVPQSLNRSMAAFAQTVWQKESEPISIPRYFVSTRTSCTFAQVPTGLKEFSANLDTNISKADRNWLQIGPRTYNTESGDFERPWPFGPESSHQ